MDKLLRWLHQQRQRRRAPARPRSGKAAASATSRGGSRVCAGAKVERHGSHCFNLIVQDYCPFGLAARFAAHIAPLCVSTCEGLLVTRQHECWADSPMCTVPPLLRAARNQGVFSRNADVPLPPEVRAQRQFVCEPSLLHAASSAKLDLLTSPSPATVRLASQLLSRRSQESKTSDDA